MKKNLENNEIYLEEKDKNINEINIIYQNYNSEKEIRIFGDKFLINNQDKCKIFYKNKEYALSTKFKVENINQLEIILKGMLNINNMENIFDRCANLISLPDIHLINCFNSPF